MLKKIKQHYKQYTQFPLWLKLIYSLLAFEFALLICFLLEKPAFFWVAKFPDVKALSGLLKMLKETGYFWTWIIAAAALICIDLPMRRLGGYKFLSRGLFLLSSALFSGLAAEILKLLIRRERPQPGLHDTAVFRDWVGAWWKSNNLSTPSSHAAVAFGAAWALSILFPRARPVWLFFAIGCGVSRMADKAHLLGDIFIAAVVSYIITILLSRKFDLQEVALNGDAEC